MTTRKIYFIVDDDRDDQQFLIDALKEKNAACQCFYAFDGEEAITKLTGAAIPAPDMIFLDLNMPLLGGRQCLAILKQMPSFKNIPIIIYSTTTNRREIDAVMQQGASFFLTKGHSFKTLLEDLSSMLIMMDH